MCGLVGMAGDLSGSKKKAFEELLTVDVVRGPHSTGVGVGARFTSKMSIVKSVGVPYELMALQDYQDMMKMTAKIYIGHNRYATIGKVNDDNAHPFLFNKVMGAHNGTLDSKCRARLHDNAKYGTDSEAIYSHINEFGAEETFKLLNNASYTGNAWALTWFDQEEGTLNIARNTKRPMYYCYSEDQCTIFWASEVEMLEWILYRNNIKIHEGKTYVITEGNHYKWEIPKSICNKFTGPTMSKIEVAPAIEPEWTFQRHNYVPHQGYYSELASGNQSVLPFPNAKKKARLSLDTKKFRPPYKDHNGQHIGKSKLMDKIADGCTFCAPKVAKDFHENFKWGDFVFFLKPDMDGRSMFLCESCYNNDDIRSVCEELI